MNFVFFLIFGEIPMKSVVLFLVCATILVGCEPTRPVSSSTRTPASSVDEVTLSSHLNGADEDDPQLFAGQKIRLVPDLGKNSGFLIHYLCSFHHKHPMRASTHNTTSVDMPLGKCTPAISRSGEARVRRRLASMPHGMQAGSRGTRLGVPSENR